MLGQNEIRKFNLVNLAQSGLTSVFIFLSLLVFRKGVAGIISGWAAAGVMVSLITVAVVNRGVKVKPGFHRGVFKESLKFGIQGHLGNIFQFMNYRLDTFIVAYFLSAAFIGYYSVAVGLAEVLWWLPGAVGTVVIARTPGMSSDALNHSTPRICRNTFFVTLVASLALAALSRFVIGLLYGPAFLPAVAPLLWLLPGVAALSIGKVLGNEIAMRGKPIVNTINVAVCLVINTALNIILIPRIGISGAALASTVSYGAATVVVIIIYLRMSKNSLVDTIIIKPEDLKMYWGMVKNFRRTA